MATDVRVRMTYGANSPDSRTLLEDDSKERRSRKRLSCSRWAICLAAITALVLMVVGYVAYQAFIADCVIDPPYIGSLPPPPLTGVLSAESAESLADAELLFPKLFNAPECQAWDEDGAMYTGTVNGDVWKLEYGAHKPTLIGRTGKIGCTKSDAIPSAACGRPLGIRVLPDKKLLIADAYVGLIKLNPEDGVIETLVPFRTLVNGRPMLIADDLAVTPDGVVYFSDASTKFTLLEAYYDHVEAGANGRVIRYDPKTGETSVFTDNLHFPNGVELSFDQSSILVAETNIYRIIRVFLYGDRAGQWEIFADNLPAHPDNIRRHPDHGYLVGLSGIRTWDLTVLEHYPFLRRLLINTVDIDEIAGKSSKYSLCLHISDSGDILRSWHDAEPRVYGSLTQCSIRNDGYMYLGSFRNRGVGKVKLTKTLSQGG
eukprot:scpid68426/ scgid34728/ Adipocyte plasma membrane-associated protein